LFIDFTYLAVLQQHQLGGVKNHVLRMQSELRSNLPFFAHM